MLTPVYVWQGAPALRLLIAFAAGIVWQWYAPLSFVVMLCVIIISTLLIALFAFLSTAKKYAAAPVQGWLITVLVIACGMLAVQQKNVRNNDALWTKQNSANALLVRLAEPLAAKPASYKAKAFVEKMYVDGNIKKASGNILIYFKKDAVSNLDYGSLIWILKTPEPVKNSGNPYAFDYQTWALRQGITHQVYLTQKDFIPTSTVDKTWAFEKVFHLRQGIVRTLQNHITGPREAGLAEALLIGYKDDLDKALVQSYSNTGIVHIIAISGMHVGFIYLLLVWLLRRVKARWLRFLLLMLCLWGFGFLAGATPSVMRSVVMASFIALGEVFSRSAPVINNLALSALLLLCINPFWLWDVGFQLSYIAVLSLVLFYKPIYHWLHFDNKIVNFFWQIIAGTLAAQVLTTPLSLFYFHQLPLLFLITNVVAVPLSTLVLMMLALLCVFAFSPAIANVLGWLASKLLWLMNAFVERIDALPFAVWSGLSVSFLQTLFLLLAISAFAAWLLQKNKKGLWIGMTALLLFTVIRTFSFAHAAAQAQLVVYNISKKSAVEMMHDRKSVFVGDENILQDKAAMQWNIQPAHTAFRIRNTTISNAKTFTWSNKKIIIIDAPVRFQTFSKPHADVVILQKAAVVDFNEMRAGQVVADASLPAWSRRRFAAQCAALKIPFHDVVEKGAFVMPLPRATFAAP